MQERPKDINDLKAVDQLGAVGELVVEKPPAQQPRGQRTQDQTAPEKLFAKQPSAYQPEGSSAEGTPANQPDESSEQPTEPQDQPPSTIEEASGSSSGQIMGSMTIRELEMVRKMDEINKLEEISVGGTTNIQPEVIAAIAGIAAQSVEGVASLGETSLGRNIRERVGASERRSRGVEVEVGRREVIVELSLRVIYGYSIPTIVVKVREAVADRLVNLCGLLAKEINVRVASIEFPSRLPGRVQ